VAATRAASFDELVQSATGRLALLASEGVGTVEVKSGYGLDAATEVRMLEVAGRAGEAAGVRVERTLLAAHAVPPEYETRPDDYIDEVVLPLVRHCADVGLAGAVDAFCEEIAFTPAQVRRVFEAAGDADLEVKLHADQLGDGGGAALAAAFEALSADHLEHASPEGVAALADAGTAAVLLPGAWLHLGGGKRPPVPLLREARVPLAVATDANPGSSPLLSLLTAAHLACSAFGLTVDEAFAGITSVAARALGLDDRGTLEVGCLADLAAWNVTSPAELLQWLGARPLHRRMMEGQWM
jgi:imidazolonepropionase